MYTSMATGDPVFISGSLYMAEGMLGANKFLSFCFHLHTLFGNVYISTVKLNSRDNRCH
jgi:hypothetical protein